MSGDTTTIEVTDEQRDYLRSLDSGSAKAALQELIDATERNNSDSGTREQKPLEELVAEVASEFEDRPTDAMHADQFAKEVAKAIDYAEVSHRVAREVAEELRQ